MTPTPWKRRRGGNDPDEKVAMASTMTLSRQLPGTPHGRDLIPWYPLPGCLESASNPSI
jgi:hypothetical protein